ncbi:hypothetical protein Tco_1082477 [Tanacetum coccineum]|uniref:Uncharacterized protein n=1 Tax=Tanacetum coccineum TaxID=301880 RepID=A0ABQ5I0L3_9ASTR
MKSFRGSTVAKYKTFVSRNYHEGHECDQEYLDLLGLRNHFTNSLCLSFVHNLPNRIYHRHLQEFYGSYESDRNKLTINFNMYGHDYTWSLEKLGTVLSIYSQRRLFYSDSTKTKDFLKHQKNHPIDTTKIDASIIQNTILKSSDHCEESAYPSWNAALVKE